MTAYATGARAWATCQRCGARALHKELVADGHYPNLRVHPGCRDIRNPQEKPFKAEDKVLLRHPVPDIDDDSAGDTGTSLTVALGFTRMMGGQE